MGEIRVKVLLENEADRFQHAQGKLPRKRIRSAEVDAIVDTGAVETLLPQELVEKLGLRLFAKTTVILADDRRIELHRAGPLALSIGDRSMMTECLVGPLGAQALIGQIVMESLDLIPDPRLRTLTPRPESPFRPTLGMRAVTVSSLLRAVTKENLHAQTEWGAPAGKETW